MPAPVFKSNAFDMRPPSVPSGQAKDLYTVQSLAKVRLGCLRPARLLDPAQPAWRVQPQDEGRRDVLRGGKREREREREPASIFEDGSTDVAMGQNPNRTPSEHPNPTTKIGSKMGGAPTNQNGIPLVLTHSNVWPAKSLSGF